MQVSYQQGSSVEELWTFSATVSNGYNFRWKHNTIQELHFKKQVFRSTLVEHYLFTNVFKIKKFLKNHLC